MQYIHCDCEHCSNGIEFPDHGLGRIIPCPHCAKQTLLRKAEVAPQPTPAEAKKPNATRETVSERRERMVRESREKVGLLLNRQLDAKEARKLRDFFGLVAMEFDDRAGEEGARKDVRKDAVKWGLRYFGREGDFGEFYRKPTKQQMGIIIDDLMRRFPDRAHFGAGPICDTIDVLMPELKRK